MVIRSFMAEADDRADASDADEWAGLKPTPRRRSPLTALVVIALAAGLGWHLRAELAYALAARAPLDLGDARHLQGALEDNRYVTVRGQPDRRNSLNIEPRGEQERQSFFRLLGTGSRLLVRALPPGRRIDLEERWAGRLRRFDDLPYAPSLREYYATQVRAARYLPSGALQAALTRGQTALADRTGEPLALTPSTPMVLDVVVPERLQVTLGGDRFPSEADARHELERLGLHVTPLDGEGERFRYSVEAPAAQRDAIADKLDAAGIAFAVDARRYQTPLGQLKASGDQLELPTGARVAWTWIAAASVEAPLVIPPDAWVLTEGEAPAGFWWAPALVALLAIFAAFNVWYLARARRA
jgi:hypothetical protein